MTPTTRKARGGAGFGILRRLWIPLVILVVIVVGGLTVSRLHGGFGSEKFPTYADSKLSDPTPTDPKQLTYEIFGASGTVASISYFDANGDPQLVEAAKLPWSITFTTTSLAVVGNVVAQGDSDTIGCRILVNGVVKAEKVTHQASALTFCLLKAA
ncbi:MmpS family transport accessory protein [Mycobacterium sp. 1423905.2]|uniref:MmpS family transport accessory protein n=1 Tax=Mycobacterium sp. 1423905.2 TaxID=1856859 RepID=UPI0012E9F0F0|nr:MmpS family transport accessory protein [Mycobacterium sp. 1423905.2]